jgi:membrane fusion protein, multidrug efflux system
MTYLNTIPLLICLHTAACSGKVAIEPAKEDAPLQVNSVDVTSEMVPVWSNVTGSVRSRAQAEVTASASGRVVEVFFDRGSDVVQGKPLLRLDVRGAALAYAESEAGRLSAKTQLETTQLECKRAVRLKASGALSEQEYERTLAQCRSAEDGVRVAVARSQSVSKSVSDGIVPAPFSGRVLERMVHVGEFVREDTKVATISGKTGLKVEFAIPERALSKVRVDTVSFFVVDAFPEQNFIATIQKVGFSVREVSRDVLVEADIDPANPVNQALRPGMFAKVRVRVGEVTRPTLPKTALKQVGSETHIFVIRRDRAEERVVVVDSEVSTDRVALSRGVDPGDRVVVSPAPDLINGKSVH